jgi:2-C-methyl-D-erythritol 4-phosphate cytidylyltransferase
MAPLGGRPVIAHSAGVFAGHKEIDRLAIVVSEVNLEAVRQLVSRLAPGAVVVAGGRRRRDSVMAGLNALGDCEYIVVHDGARPFVSEAMIDAALEGAHETGAALCAVPVTDTVKRSDPMGIVSSTVTREGLWLAQTPQAFRTALLRRAHEANDIDATDDAALVELLGEPVRLVLGSTRNLKITLQEDLRLAEALLRSG